MTYKNETNATLDYAPVPQAERRGPVTMGLLWLTMVTAFPTVLIGFEWHKAGLTLSQVLLGTALSCLLLIAYAIPATQMGARSGLSYTILSRRIFGRWGTYLITFNLIIVFLGFYGLGALLLSDALKGLFHWQLSTVIFSAVIAVAMSLNNFFGFKGVANFARYVAAPMLVVWVFYSFCKAMTCWTPGILNETSHVSFGVAITSISSFVIGWAVWGNESDYWRYSKPKTLYSVIPLALALLVGQIIFPVTGWMVARISGVTEYGLATSTMNQFSFAGLAVIGVAALAISYFAAADSILFGLIEAGENVIRLQHRTWVCIWAFLGAATAAILSITGATKSIESITSINCILLPTPTVIMLAEWLLVARYFRTLPISEWRPPALSELPILRWPATIALLAGLTVGVATSGILPGSSSWNIGICSVQAWLVSLLTYLPLRILEYNRAIGAKRLALEKSILQNVGADPIKR